MKRPNVFIIVLNWNDYESTVKCVESLEKQTYDNFRIVILDNNSQDKSGELLRERFSNHKIILNEKNLGYTGGNNIGINYAQKCNADYIYIVNNDTIHEQRSLLDNFVDVMENDKKIGIIGPKIVDKTYGNIQSIYDGSRWWDKIEHEIGLNRDNSTFTPVLRILGCSMLFRTELVEKIGDLDEGFFMYSDEDDFCLRANLNGYSVIYNQKFEVKRNTDSDKKTYNKRKTYYCTRNKILMLNKNFNGKFLWEMHIANLYGELKNILKIPSSDFKLSRIKGLKDGYLNKSGRNKNIQ
ncbi:glycosyltransferase family 2 protein [Alkalicoccobacillus gibsonii]|uniref:glycosyltransferase family 2 protein n=1 Tax=Alkalicoccobacillus gibsonii TaxID=79881 RepID=UPI0019320849|nr:glycosyltransferase family 2 protein [Alkalicoccobacillus gibsonii]MBM0065895.1 glycosyltransferase family 2 protein [Alkalicoccobacillus gibsonii]